MPQFTRFPPLPAVEAKAAVGQVVRFLRDWPIDGEPFRTQRTRLKRTDLWSRERYPDFLRFLYVAQVDPVVPSELVRAVIEAEDDDAALDALADRLWNINPLLAKVVLERLKDRVNSLLELTKYIDSFAYPGNRLEGPQLRTWFTWARGVGWLRPVGVGFALGERGTAFLLRCDEIDVDEFLDEDVDEPLPESTAPAAASAAPTAASAPPPPTSPAPTEAASAPTPAAPVIPPRAAAEPAPLTTGPDPRTLDQPIRARQLGTELSDEQTAQTAAHLAQWWAEAAPASEPAWWATLGVDGEAWMEDPEAALFRLAVAAGLRSAQASVRDPAGAFDLLDQSGVLEALYSGGAITGAPADLDPMALLRTSLIARRFADHPELAADLDRCDTAQAAFARLDAALGEGLFGLALFVLLRALSSLGLLRVKGLANYTAVPTRDVRDTLFRLGYLPSPYAANAQQLAAASTAARQATGDAPRPEALLRAFAQRAQCSYSCAHRTRCGLACRERAEQG